MMRRTLLIALFAVLSLFCAAVVQGESEDVGGAEFSARVLARDWGSVYSELAKTPDSAKSPIQCMLQAHAALATNHNNRALSLLTSDSAAVAIESWQTWTAALLAEHPDNPVACYLAGDAEARSGNPEMALQLFHKGLQIAPDDAKILNACGAAWAMQGQLDSSIYCVSRAIAVDHEFADAWASRGSILIKSKNGATGALSDFQKALELSPDFALALNGRACAEFAMGQWDSAQTDLVDATDACDEAEIARANMVMLASAKVTLAVDTAADEEAKMSLDKARLTMQRLGNQIAVVGDVGLHAMYGTLRDLRPSINAGLSTQGGAARVGLGVGATPDWASIARDALTMLQSDMGNRYDAIHNIDLQLHNMGPGGVLIDVQKGYVDEGNWLDTWLGLGYAVPSSKLTQK